MGVVRARWAPRPGVMGVVRARWAPRPGVMGVVRAHLAPGRVSWASSEPAGLHGRVSWASSEPAGLHGRVSWASSEPTWLPAAAPVSHTRPASLAGVARRGLCHDRAGSWLLPRLLACAIMVGPREPGSCRPAFGLVSGERRRVGRLPESHQSHQPSQPGWPHALPAIARSGARPVVTPMIVTDRGRFSARCRSRSWERGGGGWGGGAAGGKLAGPGRARRIYDRGYER